MTASAKLIGKYEIIEEIGRGGFATVYRARDTRIGREVALKVIHGNFAQEPDFVARFKLEVQTAARLRHPNIVAVYDFDDADGVLYLVMELIKGSSLRAYLDDRKRLTLDQALPILRQVADALDYLASLQLVHRDIKPANILLEGEADRLLVKLTDFGLVRSLESSTQLTQTQSIMGTPTYMAPEQSDAKKWGDVTSATDVYALGVVVYEMLCGRPPFEGETLTVMHAHAYDQPPSPLEFVPDLGADLETVLLRVLNKTASARYASAGALFAVMQQVQQHGQKQARPSIPMRGVHVGAGGRLEFNEKSIPQMDLASAPAPKPAPAPTRGEPSAPIDVQTLRVDAAVPEQVFVDRVFDLAVAVRQMTSPLLAVKDLTHVESGEVQTTWEVGMPLINLRTEVDAPDCEIIGKSSIQFRLARGKDAPPIYFRLKPRRVGELSIVVTVYQEDYALGSARVSTLAAEQMTRPAGKVQLTIASQPLWLDCELRIFNRLDHDYHAELTLNGEQTFGGAVSADLATWVATGDPTADGQALFKTLLADDELLKAWGEARGRSKQRRVRLRLDPPELHTLPWELLRDADEPIAADADTPFSRYLAIGKEWGRPRADRPVRVLAVISNPSDLNEEYNLPSADVKLEEKTLREALSPSPTKGEGWGEGVSLTFLTPPITLARLEAELRRGYHVLHFIGHGGFNTKQQQAALYFENDDGTAHRVVDADFAGMLDRLQAPPQLAVLAACQSAQQSLHDVFTGLGPKLVQIGLPAVVAMHADITMLTARQFAATFYRRLLDHGMVDLALNEARSTLITHGRYDAAVPVLFMRLRDGRLWGEAPRAAVPLIEPPQSIGRSPLSQEDRESLERQFQLAWENLRLIEERKAEYVLETDVPLQIVKEERRLRATIAELEAKLRGSQ